MQTSRKEAALVRPPQRGRVASCEPWRTLTVPWQPPSWAFLRRRGSPPPAQRRAPTPSSRRLACLLHTSWYRTAVRARRGVPAIGTPQLSRGHSPCPAAMWRRLGNSRCRKPSAGPRHTSRLGGRGCVCGTESDFQRPWALRQSQRSSCLRTGQEVPSALQAVTSSWQGEDGVGGHQCSASGQERAGRGDPRGQFADPCSQLCPVSKLHLS